MYQEIENILVRTLSSFEYEQLENLKEQYSEEQIINAYKTSKVKNVNYISKILKDKVKQVPKWLNQEIKPQSIDEETKELEKEFKNFIEEFKK